MTIYRGYDIKKVGMAFQIRYDGKLLETVASEQIALTRIDLRLRAWPNKHKSFW